MTRAEFRAALKDLGMSRVAFAEQVGLHAATVYHWGENGRPIPYWAEVLIAAWQKNKVLEAYHDDQVRLAQGQTATRTASDRASMEEGTSAEGDTTKDLYFR